MNKIDRRITYIVMLDTETCNTIQEDKGLDMSSVLVYDIGWQIIDKRGKVYEQKSYINSDIFYHEAELMKSAYYAKKIPKYLQDIMEGKRQVATYYEIRKDLCETMAQYETNIVCAHNARFDYNSTNITQRWLTKSKYRYFLPYGTEVWDTLKMAQDVVAHTPTYIAFCQQNGYMTKHKTPRPQLTAEILYRYISGNNQFVESHTGLEDVDIERQILAYCFRKHRAMAKGAWEKSRYKKVEAVK